VDRGRRTTEEGADIPEFLSGGLYTRKIRPAA
jgi:hypothetical protein